MSVRCTVHHLSSIKPFEAIEGLSSIEEDLNDQDTAVLSGGLTVSDISSNREPVCDSVEITTVTTTHRSPKEDEIPVDSHSDLFPLALKMVSALKLPIWFGIYMLALYTVVIVTLLTQPSEDEVMNGLGEWGQCVLRHYNGYDDESIHIYMWLSSQSASIDGTSYGFIIFKVKLFFTC